MRRRFWTLGPLLAISCYSCKTVDREQGDAPASSASAEAATTGAAVTKTLSMFECLDVLRPYSQGFATEFSWPDKTAVEAEQDHENVYRYALIAPNESAGKEKIYLEDNDGKVYVGEVQSDKKKLDCPDEGDLFCFTFNLPQKNSPTFATQFQLFEDESLITSHDPIDSSNHDEFASYPKVQMMLAKDTGDLVIKDIKLRLSRLDETKATLTMNLTDDYAKAVSEEIEEVRIACEATVSAAGG